MPPQTQDKSLASPFSVAELAAWRSRLLALARSLRSDVQALESEGVMQERVGPNHNLPEGGSELQTAAVDASAAASDDEVLRLVLRALEKIETAMPVPFGICELTLRPIEPERLELMPWAPFGAAASAALERRGLTPDDRLLPDAPPR